MVHLPPSFLSAGARATGTLRPRYLDTTCNVLGRHQISRCRLHLSLVADGNHGETNLDPLVARSTQRECYLQMLGAIVTGTNQEA